RATPEQMLTRPTRIEIIPQEHRNERSLEPQCMLDEGACHPSASTVRRIANNGGAERDLGAGQGQEILFGTDCVDADSVQTRNHRAIAVVTGIKRDLNASEFGLREQSAQHPPRRRRGRIRLIRNSIVAADPLSHGTPEAKRRPTEAGRREVFRLRALMRREPTRSDRWRPRTQYDGRPWFYGKPRSAARPAPPAALLRADRRDRSTPRRLGSCCRLGGARSPP